MMNRDWKAIVGAALLLAVCDSAFGQMPSKHAPETMSIGARIREERVNVRSGPGADFDRTRLVDKEERVTVTACEGDWAQIEFSSGATGWIGTKFLDPEKPIVPPKAAGVAKSSAIATAAMTPTTAKFSATSTTAANGPANKPVVVTQAQSTKPSSSAASKKPAEVSNDLTAALAGTKPDILGGAKETGATGSGEPFRVLIVLVPILGGIWLAMRGLKAVQTRTGSLPDFRKGLRGAILGGFNLNNARKTGGSSLRVVESIPIGTASLYLVEARGRTLLLGASGGSLTTLADLTESAAGPAVSEASDFRSVLDAMSQNLADDQDDLQAGVGMMVGSLEDRIRQTREAIARAAVRTGRG